MLHIDPAVHSAVALVDDRIPHFERPRAVEDFLAVRDAVFQRRIENQWLDGRSRRIKTLQRTVYERTFLVLPQAVPLRLNIGRIERGTRCEHENRPAFRLEHDDSPAPFSQRLVCRFLQCGIECQIDVVAACGRDNLRERPQSPEKSAVSGKLCPLISLDGRAADRIIKIACDRCHDPPVRIAPFAYVRAERENFTLSIKDAAAQHAVLGESRAAIQRMFCELIRLPDLQIDDIKRQAGK